VTKLYTDEYFSDKVQNKTVPVSRRAACFSLIWLMIKIILAVVNKDINEKEVGRAIARRARGCVQSPLYPLPLQ